MPTQSEPLIMNLEEALEAIIIHLFEKINKTPKNEDAFFEFVFYEFLLPKLKAGTVSVFAYYCDELLKHLDHDQDGFCDDFPVNNYIIGLILRKSFNEPPIKSDIVNGYFEGYRKTPDLDDGKPNIVATDYDPYDDADCGCNNHHNCNEGSERGLDLILGRGARSGFVERIKYRLTKFEFSADAVIQLCDDIPNAVVNAMH